MATYEFLSPEWITEARRIRDEFSDQAEPPAVPIKGNLIIKDSPFAESEIRGYVDTSSGQLVIDEGRLDDADLTLTTDYATAKALFVGKDTQAAMQALLSGKIRAVGDVSKLLSLQGPANPEQASMAAEVARRVDEMTAQ